MPGFHLVTNRHLLQSPKQSGFSMSSWKWFELCLMVLGDYFAWIQKDCRRQFCRRLLHLKWEFHSFLLPGGQRVRPLIKGKRAGMARVTSGKRYMYLEVSSRLVDSGPPPRPTDANAWWEWPLKSTGYKSALGSYCVWGKNTKQQRMPLPTHLLLAPWGNPVTGTKTMKAVR